MAADEGERLRVEPLGPRHDRSRFDSGVEPLDRYFRTQASQEAKRRVAAPLVLALSDGSIAGYYTLSATSILLADLPEFDCATTAALSPRSGDAARPARGGPAKPRPGLRPLSAGGALCRTVRSDVASFAVVVDAKNDDARRFYERESFLPFSDRPGKLFRPLADIAKLFD